MKSIKAIIFIVICFLAFIGLLSIIAIKSCTSAVNHLVDQAFDIEQRLTVKNGIYHIEVPLMTKDTFIESSSPQLESFCVDISQDIKYNGAEGGEECFNGTCRFYFKTKIPKTFEYLTTDEDGQCTVVNTFQVDPSAVKKLYEINILIPEDVSQDNENTIEIKALPESQFESSGYLSIGSRTRVDLEYSRPVKKDQLLINNQLFKIKAKSSK